VGERKINLSNSSVKRDWLAAGFTRFQPAPYLNRYKDPHMFRPLLAVISLLAPLIALASSDISDFDVATYVLTRQDGSPTGMQMRLAKVNDKWFMEGKNGSAPWKNISCDKGCEYRASTNSERETFLAALPTGMQKQFDIACIQNSANAFCRLTKKDSPSKGGYAFVALVTGKPVPMTLQRLTRPYPSNPAVNSDAAR
jgi:hypothetical protein